MTIKTPFCILCVWQGLICTAWMNPMISPVPVWRSTMFMPRARVADILQMGAKSPSQNEEDDGGGAMLSLDDLWLGDDLDDLLFDNHEEPDAFLSDDDLSLLHEINIPALPDGASQNGIPSTSPQIISLQTLNQISSNISYFYLRDELGLGEDVMWKITNEAGSVLGMKAANIRKKVDLLRNTIKLSDTDVRQLISSMPTLLHLSATKNLSPTILFLLRQLDLSTKDLRTLVIGCPALLAYSIPNIQEKIAFFQYTLDCSMEETRRILLKDPRLLTCSTETGLLPRLEFLHKEVQIPITDIRKIVQKNPRILKMSVDQNLQPKLIFYFIMTLHLTPEEVRKILLKFPGILDYNLDNHMLPITRFFLSLDVSPREFAHMLGKFPRLVTNSLAKIKHVVGYLRFELGLEANDVRRILYQAPQVVGLTTKNLQSKVDFLLQATSPGATRGDDSSTRLLRKVIVGMPTLLYLSIEKNLAPKVEYLQEKLGNDELSAAMHRQPTLLGYSLEKRIQPRLEKILNAGVDGRALTVGITLKEEAFEKWLEARVAKIGRDPMKPRSSKSAENLDPVTKIDEMTTQFTELPQSEDQQIRDGGRIVHWTRQRRG